MNSGHLYAPAPLPANFVGEHGKRKRSFNMITRLNFFSAKRDSVDKLRELLVGVVLEVKSLPGCNMCRVVQSDANPAQFVVIEEWESIEAHQRATQAISQAKFLAVLALLDGAPKGDYYRLL